MGRPLPVPRYNKPPPAVKQQGKSAFQHRMDWALKTAALQEGRDPKDPELLKELQRTYRLRNAWIKTRVWGKYAFVLSTPALVLYAWTRDSKGAGKKKVEHAVAQSPPTPVLQTLEPSRDAEGENKDLNCLGAERKEVQNNQLPLEKDVDPLGFQKDQIPLEGTLFRLSSLNALWMATGQCRD
ncbi:hypothetical protein LTR08_006396 [Meristemomyces frigidus]|nr:hypothetical protein LTR08_006396 [Meristemomyces frigidus]